MVYYRYFVYFEMRIYSCAVIGWINSCYHFDQRKKSSCDVNPHMNQDICGCQQPYRLYCFPGPRRSAVQGERQIKVIRRGIGG